MTKKYQNLDSDTGMFFTRELEQVKTQSYDVLYPELLARRLFPLDTTTDTGASTVTYRSWDFVGMAKLIHEYGDDLPNIEVSAKETTRRIYGIGVAFGYSIQDIRNARFAQKPLEERKAAAARRQLLQKENELAFDGDATTEIPGFLNNPNVNVTTPVDGASGTTDWASKTPDEIIKDVSNMTADIRSTSNGVEAPTTLLIPEEQYTYITTTPRSSTSDTTIADFIITANPFVEEIIPTYNLAGKAPANAAYDSEDMAILYDRNRDKLWLECPQDVEYLEEQYKNMMYEIPAHLRTAGVIVAYPKSISQLNGI